LVIDRLTAAPERRIADRTDAVRRPRGFHPGRAWAAAGRREHMACIFNDFCEAAGAEKIKTIGDSHMTVGGSDGNAREGAAAARGGLENLDRAFM
jgi:hypothetical protein